MPAPSRHSIAYGRWYAKKLARGGLALAASGTSLVGTGNHPPGVRVLTYHRFGKSLRDPFCVTVEDFERHMAWIARHHAVVSLADVEAFLAGKKPLGQDAVLVTVDDGSPCLLRHALPILQACGIPAVAFVPAGELDRCDHGIASSRETAEARMTWAELDVLTKAGITIGSHGWTHRSLAGMPIEQAREEATRSRECLEAHVGLPVTAFAYPFGRRADYTAATGRILLECGYACAFTARHGAIRVGLDPFTLPRIKIEGGDPLWIFQLASTGALDAWSLVDRRLWWLQAGV